MAAICWQSSLLVREEGKLANYYLIVDVFPIIQSNQLKRGEHRPQKIVEICIPVVWIRANAKADGFLTVKIKLSVEAVARNNEPSLANLAPVALPQIIGSSSSSNAQLDEFQVHLWTIQDIDPLPGMIETVLRALNTRNVLKPAKFPTSIPIVA
ncbi:unnamed protein product [Heterotrigona itama]|uniref:Uncharacterized protein n=1 Tax=Heterotrigona itama TaxID=395501 RepID=A0A6V7H9X5_9HYME|nr:unnamed protein product [Heterotrigona itama]